MREEKFFKVSYIFYVAALSLNKMSAVETFVTKRKKDVAQHIRHRNWGRAIEN